MKSLYHFGELVREIDYFAFPRTGSHFFRYCTSGLFDIVSRTHAHIANPEAIDRQQEINPQVLYGLDLREPGVPFQPIWINTVPNGVHGRPIDGSNPVIVVIRNPVATAYSLYRVHRDRWHGVPSIDSQVSVEWLSQTLQEYSAFYNAAFDLLDSLGDRGLLIRYEDLVATADPLHRLVQFCGVKPKLQPDFVHFLTRFDLFAKPGDRTFYRAGDNEAWRRDQVWMEILGRLSVPDFSRFGY